MEQITEESGIQKEWYAEASNQTLETLPAFLSHLMNDYKHDYGTVCHALTAGSIATAWAMNKHNNGGITGFQAGAIMWEFIRNWNYSDNKTGLKLINYDNMLFPQYADSFNKTISKDTWKAIQNEAKINMLKENASEDVRKHWQSVIDGIVPFGYSVTKN